MQDTEPYTCVICEEVADDPQSSDTRWSNVKDGWVCWPCFESESQRASTVWFVGTDGEARRFYVSDVEICNEYGDTDTTEVDLLSREYVYTGGWRGYHLTKIEGWTEVESGWTTGGWGDAIAQAKQTFNEWAESILTGAVVPSIPVAIVTDPTSNVFSTAITVYVPQQYADGAWERLAGEDADRLSNALR